MGDDRSDLCRWTVHNVFLFLISLHMECTYHDAKYLHEIIYSLRYEYASLFPNQNFHFAMHTMLD
jgi:hypothetical protein